MGEILNLPSYYGVSTSCATRLMLAKLILLYSFWSEPWESMIMIITAFIRRVPWIGEFNLPIARLFTPLLTLEMLTNSLVLTGILVESGICLVPWLGLNMLGIGVTSFMFLDSTLYTGGVRNTSRNMTILTNDDVLPTDNEYLPNGNHVLIWLCLLYILCQQYSAVLELYFFLFKRSMLFFPRRLIEDTQSLEDIKVEKKSESCYQPVVVSTNNNFKTTLAEAKNINYVNDHQDVEKDENESVFYINSQLLLVEEKLNKDADTVETTSLLSSNTNSSSGGCGGLSTDTIPPVPNTPPPTSTPLQPSLIFPSSFQPHLPGTYLELETKPPKVRSRTQSRTSRTSKDIMMLDNKDGKQRMSAASELDVSNNRKSWESFKFSLEKENFE